MTDAADLDTPSPPRQRVPGPGPGVAEADEHLAIVVDDVVDGQADQASVLGYSDDHHIGLARHRRRIDRSHARDGGG